MAGWSRPGELGSRLTFPGGNPHLEMLPRRTSVGVLGMGESVGAQRRRNTGSYTKYRVGVNKLSVFDWSDSLPHQMPAEKLIGFCIASHRVSMDELMNI